MTGAGGGVHRSMWEGVHGKRLERGGPFKKETRKVIGQTFSVSYSKWTNQNFSLPVEPVGNDVKLPTNRSKAFHHHIHLVYWETFSKYQHIYSTMFFKHY